MARRAYTRYRPFDCSFVEVEEQEAEEADDDEEEDNEGDFEDEE